MTPQQSALAVLVFLVVMVVVILALKTMKHGSASASLSNSVESMAFQQGQPQRRNKGGNAN